MKERELCGCEESERGDEVEGGMKERFVRG